MRRERIDPGEPIARVPRPTSENEAQLASVFHYIGLAFGIAVVALGVTAFYRGLSLPPNTPEHRAHGKGDSWRI
jgi:hypothetical protein